MHLEALGQHFNNTSRVLATLWEMREEYWRSFQQCLQISIYTLGNAPIKSGDPMGTFPTWSPTNKKQQDSLGLSPTVSLHFLGIFYPFSQSMAVLLNLFLKLEI
jgi:hypothetical protein